jgi:hypothetical protein
MTTTENANDPVCMQQKNSVEKQVENLPKIERDILLNLLKDAVTHGLTARSKLTFYSRAENKIFISELCKTGRTTTDGRKVVIFSNLRIIELAKDPSDINPVMRLASGFFNLINCRRKAFLKRYHRSFLELFYFEILASPFYHSFRREVIVKFLASGFLTLLAYFWHKFF